MDLPYRRPVGRHSQYTSRTIWAPNGWRSARLTIQLVWMNHCPWIYVVELQGTMDRSPDQDPKFILEHENLSGVYPYEFPEGKDLNKCRYAAEVVAQGLCAKYNLDFPVLAPYTPREPFRQQRAI